VRVANFIPFLQEHGVSLDFRSTLTDEEYALLAARAPVTRKALTLLGSAAAALRRAPDQQLLLVHRLRLLTPAPGIDPPRRLDVYDLDDALFLGSPAEVNRRFQWVKQEARRSLACLRRARLVIAGNSFLASRAREHARRVEVVPSLVDPARQPVHRHGRAEVITVGWIGSPTTVAYLQPVLRALEVVNRDAVRARLVVVGGDTGWRTSWVEHRPWSLRAEPEELAAFDIGVMPLPDNDWARGKCGYKILQYFSAGVPAVASPVGVAREMVGDDRGLSASTPTQWSGALRRLIDDAEERCARGSLGRQYVEREYSYEKWAPELAQLLRSMAAG
jgi:glycosyltransferase involved in cell wall biosynthesis